MTDDDPLAARLAAELEALGLEVARALIDPTVADRRSGARSADGRRARRGRRRRAADRVLGRRGGLRPDRACARSWRSRAARRWSRCCRCAPSSSCASAWAWSAGPRPPPPDVVPPPAPPRPAEPRVALGVLSGVVASTGSLPPFATVARRPARAHRRSRWASSCAALAPIGTHRAVDGHAGTDADMSVWLAGGGLVLAPRTAARCSLRARRGRDGRDACAPSASSAWPIGPRTTRLDWRPTVARRRASASAPRWAVRLDVIGGSTAPAAPIVTFTDGHEPRDVTIWGVGFVSCWLARSRVLSC